MGILAHLERKNYNPVLLRLFWTERTVTLNNTRKKEWITFWVFKILFLFQYTPLKGPDNFFACNERCFRYSSKFLMTCWIYNGWHWGIKDLRSKARKHTSRNSKLLLQQSYTFGDCMSINITPLFFKKLYFILFQICNLRLLHSNKLLWLPLSTLLHDSFKSLHSLRNEQGSTVVLAQYKHWYPCF